MDRATAACLALALLGCPAEAPSFPESSETTQAPPGTTGGPHASGSTSTTSVDATTTTEGTTSRATSAATTDGGSGPTEGPGTTTAPLDGSDTQASSSDATTTVDMPCGELGCEACFDCAAETKCQAADAACDAFPGCPTAAACLRDCILTGLCFEACCRGLPGAGMGAATALLECQSEACEGTCPDIDPINCD